MAGIEKGGPRAKDRQPAKTTMEPSWHDRGLFANEPHFTVRTYRGRCLAGKRIIRFFLPGIYAAYYCDHARRSPVWYVLVFHCRERTVDLYSNEARAWEAWQRQRDIPCGGVCNRRHGVMKLIVHPRNGGR